METGRYLRLLRRMNWTILGSIIVLAVVGVLFVRSACYSNIVEDQSAVRYQKQVMWSIVGFVCLIGFTLVDYRKLARHAWWAYGAAVFLLILVLLVGRTVHGGRRWLWFMGIGFQPAEFAKVAVIILLAWIMGLKTFRTDSYSSAVLVLAVVGIPTLLVSRQPDVGTAAVFVPVIFTMMFVAGFSWRILLSLILVGVVVVSVFVGALFLPAKLGCSPETQARITKVTGAKPYHRQRIETFLHPDSDPLGAGWSRMQSEIAVGSGGLWGKGYLNGTANILGFLPRTVAPTDFIFSVVAEEAGFAGALTVLCLFGATIAGGIRVAAAASDRLGRLLCIGVVTMLFTHVFVNVAMTVGRLPITGLPLPLMSSGGSITVTTLIGLGIVQSVYVRRRIIRY
ncbi:MAG: rod shape-determining protein RodA [Lentisphaerales bacterium]|jgi:rod shape determining protein RodA|nr:MAG: rod shape-determining protein RodA [Lentisphaerales bacterium]